MQVLVYGVKIAKEMEPVYSDVTTDYMFIDNCAMRVLTEPTFFDVIVTENTFGDILTDETSCITGSMGLQPSSSIGEYTPLFEPVHGSWPQAAGKILLILLLRYYQRQCYLSILS